MPDVTKSIDLEAAPEDVWQALVDGKKLSSWTECEATVTPRKGGTLRLAWDEEWIATGTIEAFEPAKRLLTTWEWEGDDEETSLEITLAKTPQGTRLTLAHRGFEDADTAEEHADNWASYLQKLPRVLGTR